MRLGRQVAEALDGGINTDPVIDHIKTFLPTYQHTEYELRNTINNKGMQIPLLSRLDGFNPDKLTIGEVKTGKKWTQSMVDSSDQITFYTLQVFLNYKQFPEKINLHWLATVEEEGNIYLTGDIKTFNTTRNITDIFKLQNRIGKAWQGIIKMSNKELNV